MNKQHDANLDENPEWTDKDFAKAKLSSETQPAHVVRALVRRPGRPVGSKKANPKSQIALRVDQDLVNAFKANGPGWQTRMNDALRPRVDVTYSAAVKGWLVTVVRPMVGAAGRVHDILGRYDDEVSATDAAYLAAGREPVQAKVQVWPKSSV